MILSVVTSGSGRHVRKYSPALFTEPCRGSLFYRPKKMLLRDSKGLSSCTEKAAVRPSCLPCIPAPVSCHLRCRKTIPVPYSSGFFNPPHQYTKQPYKAELLQKNRICKKKVVDDTENYVIILEYMCVYIITQSVVVTTEGTEGRLGI